MGIGIAPTEKLHVDGNILSPDVPSAKEVEANGHSVGDMDVILLRK